MFKTSLKTEKTEKDSTESDIFDWMSTHEEYDTEEKGITSLIKSSWTSLTFNKTDDGSYGGLATTTNYRSNSTLTDKALQYLKSITPIGIKITQVASLVAKVCLEVEQKDALRNLCVKNILVTISYMSASGNIEKVWGVPVENGQPLDLILLFRKWSEHKSVLTLMNDSSFAAKISFELEQNMDEQTAKELLVDKDLPACV